MKNPCKDCPRKGCGTYHDLCEEYQKWKKEDARRKDKGEFYGTEYVKYSTFKSRTNHVFKCTKKERH